MVIDSSISVTFLKFATSDLLCFHFFFFFFLPSLILVSEPGVEDAAFGYQIYLVLILGLWTKFLTSLSPFSSLTKDKSWYLF